MELRYFIGEWCCPATLPVAKRLYHKSQRYHGSAVENLRSDVQSYEVAIYHGSGLTNDEQHEWMFLVLLWILICLEDEYHLVGRIGEVPRSLEANGLCQMSDWYQGSAFLDVRCGIPELGFTVDSVDVHARDKLDNRLNFFHRSYCNCKRGRIISSTLTTPLTTVPVKASPATFTLTTPFAPTSPVYVDGPMATTTFFPASSGLSSAPDSFRSAW